MLPGIRGFPRCGRCWALRVVPDDLVGEPIVMVVALWAGDTARAERAASPGDSALGARDAAWAYQLLTVWADSGDDAPNSAWTRAAAAELTDRGRPDPWPNFVPEGDHRRLAVPYAPETSPASARPSAHWDPDNLFRSNHNIGPAL